MCNIFMHIILITRKKGKNRKEKNIQFATLQNMCNITNNYEKLMSAT